MKNKVAFTSKVWIYPGMVGNWHFLSLPKKNSAQIKNTFGPFSRGWGSLPVEAQLGKTKWKTSIFPDKKRGTYLLPVKANVRKLEGIVSGDSLKVKLTIVLEHV